MPKRRTATRTIAALALAAAAPLSLAADNAKIQPGQWRSTETVIEMTNPLMSPELVARRKAKPVSVEYCVRSDELRAILVGKDAGGVCAGELSFAGGKVSGTRTCGNGVSKAKRTFEGTWSATKVDTVREAWLETPKGPAHTKVRVVSERIGECPPGA